MIKFYKYSTRISISIIVICIMAIASQIVNATTGRGLNPSVDLMGVFIIMSVGINAGLFLFISFCLWDRWIYKLIKSGEDPLRNN